MKNFHVILPTLAFVFWGCTPAQFGYNAGGTVSALSDNPNGGGTNTNPTIPGGGGTDPTKPGVHNDDDEDGDKCNDHDHKKPVELKPDHDSNSSDSDSNSNDSESNDKDHGHKYSCMNSNGKKVLICHVPGGDYKKQHTLCISVQGAVNGHRVSVGDLKATPRTKGKHTKDYLGACGEQPPNPNPVEQ